MLVQGTVKDEDLVMWGLVRVVRYVSQIIDNHVWLVQDEGLGKKTESFLNG